MIDMIKTIEAKSNQLNADDLMGAPITVKITKVSAGNSEQPIAINYEGDNGKPFYPCKSMRRVLVAVWGVNAADYIGRSMTLYRDAEVKFGGIAVGGIRISHMSGIDKPIVMALTATRANKKPYTVKPLVVAVAPRIDVQALKDKLKTGAELGAEGLKQAWLALSATEQTLVKDYKDELKLTIGE
jgi:hypothetical protein